MHRGCGVGHLIWFEFVTLPATAHRFSKFLSTLQVESQGENPAFLLKKV
jgi:hypothetical protein